MSLKNPSKGMSSRKLMGVIYTNAGTGKIAMESFTKLSQMKMFIYVINAYIILIKINVFSD